MAILKSNSSLYERYKGVHRLKPAEFNRFKKRILSLVRSGNIDCKPVVIKSAKISVTITLSGIEHSMNLRGSMAKCKSITVIRDLLKYALVTSFEPQKGSSGLMVVKLQNIISVDGTFWKVYMVVKQGENGRYYYHHDLAVYKKTE